LYHILYISRPACESRAVFRKPLKHHYICST
jgi:hypothetical protein